MQKRYSLTTALVAVLLLCSLTSCEDILEQYFPHAPAPTPTPTYPSLGLDIPFYALSGGTRLDAYSTKNPASRTASVVISGLQPGEKLLAMDFRPATGQLYGLGSTSRLYVLDQQTGTARAVGSGAFTPALAGNLVGFDFNPTVDRIRVVTSTGQNLRLHPVTGAVVATEGLINGAEGATLTAVAYTNSRAGAATTELYAINTHDQQLYRISSPNEGTLTAVGALGLSVTGDGGFDIDVKTGTALGLFPVNGLPTLFSVDLKTGKAQPLAQYSASLGYTALAVPSQPVAYTVDSFFAGRTGVLISLRIFDPTSPHTQPDPAVPDAPVTKTPTGLAVPGQEYLDGIDFRPATGQLYLLTSQHTSPYVYRLYTLDAATSAATLVATMGLPLTSEVAAFTFNPTEDRVRIISFEGQNIRMNPTDGTVVVDAPLTPGGSPFVTDAAYDKGANLYVVGRDQKLYRQPSTTSGALTPVGSLGVTDAGLTSFSIGRTNNAAYAFFTGNSESRVHSVNLATGQATALSGAFGFTGYLSSDIAVGLGF
ncbi:DUF4394 domain-containing protein [Hymenobacter sp. BT491]|uniref:DUF4394 domain-containing protein n=1 Tax=Hymenobacter sp. BT491 TaxID=2766779 RepID=UPI00165397FC|nr:DUF4394 domain-containing protein [Hymenobacter sp. BT491]MBC6988996.1 DUF4394 domain-containing protein [Hymenobacter sp. BT491]